MWCESLGGVGPGSQGLRRAFDGGLGGRAFPMGLLLLFWGGLMESPTVPPVAVNRRQPPAASGRNDAFC